MTGVRRILFASDFSKQSGRAFATAVKMARTNRATLTVLHVIQPPVPISLDEYVGPGTWRELDQKTRRWTKRKLDALTLKAGKHGVSAEGLTVDGSPLSRSCAWPGQSDSTWSSSVHTDEPGWRSSSSGALPAGWSPRRAALS
jgi:nucleotide-binding universal stress UspA family protein